MKIINRNYNTLPQDEGTLNERRCGSTTWSWTNMSLGTITLALVGVCISYASESEESACCVTEDPHAKHTMSSSAEHTSRSIFNVESSWENQLGERGPLSQIGGRSQVVAMVYTTCQYACPRIVADLKAIESALSTVNSSAIGFTLITIDPERDTTAAYNTYAKKNNLDDSLWTFLRGKPGDILELANLLGVKYKKLPDGEFSHSNIITLLNRNGEITTQLNGLGADPAELISAAKKQLHIH